jgi:hypothetical protein
VRAIAEAEIIHSKVARFYSCKLQSCGQLRSLDLQGFAFTFDRSRSCYTEIAINIAGFSHGCTDWQPSLP